MSKNINGKVELNFSFPNDKRFEDKTDKQKIEILRKTFMSVANSGCLKVNKVKIAIK